MRVCICGGGNLGHVVAGFIAAQNLYEVILFTRRPEQWSRQLVVETPSGEELSGQLYGIYSDPQKAVSSADIVLLCLPGFSIHEVLLQIKDYLKPSTAVGSVVSSTGFFFEAMNVLPPTTALFGFQRVPFISRLVDYGHRARLLGYKDCLHLAIERLNEKEELRLALEIMLRTPIRLLNNHYEASLSNSNPLLHPSRLYSLWHNWREGEVYSRIPLFYEEWTEEAARLYIDMDNELQALLQVLPVAPGCVMPVLEFYESHDAESLAQKLRSITAFKGIAAPMRKVDEGYVPDFNSRYFREDFPFGLEILARLAQEKGIPAPTIDRVCEWGMSCLN